MTNSLVAYVTDANLVDTRKLMWALGHQPEAGNTFSVPIEDSNGLRWACHSVVSIVPPTLPSGIVWEAFNLTEQRAQEVLNAIVVDEADVPIDDWGSQRFLATVQGAGLGLSWIQPLEATTAYPTNTVRWHNGIEYFSRRNANVWEPGTTDCGWQPTGEGPHTWFHVGNEGWIGPVTVTHNNNTYDLPEGQTDFREPGTVGAIWIVQGGGSNAWQPGTNYVLNDVRNHNGEDWRNLRPNNTQQLAPGTAFSGWIQITNRPAAWYNLGNEGYPVTLDGTPMETVRNGRLWRNTVSGNTFEPGVFGWTDLGPI